MSRKLAGESLTPEEEEEGPRLLKEVREEMRSQENAANAREDDAEKE